MDIKFKVNSISKNVVRMSVVKPGNSKDDDLKASGFPNYGSCELVVPDEKVLSDIKAGDEVDATINFNDPVIEADVTE